MTVPYITLSAMMARSCCYFSGFRFAMTVLEHHPSWCSGGTDVTIYRYSTVNYSYNKMISCREHRDSKPNLMEHHRNLSVSQSREESALRSEGPLWLQAPIFMLQHTILVCCSFEMTCVLQDIAAEDVEDGECEPSHVTSAFCSPPITLGPLFYDQYVRSRVIVR